MQGDDHDLSQFVAYLETLGRLGNAQTVPELLLALRHKEPIIRQVAATALGHIGDPSAVPSLLESLDDSSSNVRQAVAWSLGQIGDDRALAGLASAVQDAAGNTRWAAIWALRSLEDQHALTGIEPAQRGPDESISRASAVNVESPDSVQQPVDDIVEPARSIPASPGDTVSRRSRGLSHRHPGRWIALGILILSAIVLGAAGLSWNRSLGPELIAPDTLESFPTSVALPASPGQPICGGPLVVMLLLVGNDDPSSDTSTGFADVIRVARIDYVTREISLLAVPRDLWVPIPGLESHGISGNRVKTAYTYGEHFAVPGGGPSLLAQTLASNFGLHIDHYVVITFAAFENGIDKLGGIDIYLPESVTSETPGSSSFSSGWQHMDGHTALVYARFRPDNSTDLARIDRQTQVIAAVRDKMLGPQALSVWPDLALSLRQSALTDLSPSDISSLTCIGRRLSSEDIRTVTIEGDMVFSVIDEYGHERLLPNSEAIRQFVRAFNLGQLAP
jgi:LCP family protein required for cell wall assembly